VDCSQFLDFIVGMCPIMHPANHQLRVGRESARRCVRLLLMAWDHKTGTQHHKCPDLIMKAMALYGIGSKRPMTKGLEILTKEAASQMCTWYPENYPMSATIMPEMSKQALEWEAK